MIVELFSRGNLVLCKEDYTIIIAKDYQKWSQRTIRGGIKYKYPEKENNILTITSDGFKKTILNSNKENIIKALAIDFSLGGVYAEELCKLSGIDKNKKKPDDKELEILFRTIKKILNKKIRATYYAEKDITPFEVKTYSSM